MYKFGKNTNKKSIFSLKYNFFKIILYLWNIYENNFVILPTKKNINKWNILTGMN